MMELYARGEQDYAHQLRTLLMPGRLLQRFID
jgi:hypothetical protein